MTEKAEKTEPINIFCKDDSLVSRSERTFSLLLALLYEDGTDLDSTRSEEITVDLVLRFGTLLGKVQNEKNQHYKVSSLYKLLSAVVSTVLRKRFPKAEIYL